MKQTGNVKHCSSYNGHLKLALKVRLYRIKKHSLGQRTVLTSANHFPHHNNCKEGEQLLLRLTAGLEDTLINRCVSTCSWRYSVCAVFHLL